RGGVRGRRARADAAADLRGAGGGGAGAGLALCAGRAGERGAVAAGRAGGAVLALPGGARGRGARGSRRGGDGRGAGRMRWAAAVSARADFAGGAVSTFADTARRLSGVAARVLGWRPGEFWAATPAELAAVFEPAGGAATALSRAELNALMERDHG